MSTTTNTTITANTSSTLLVQKQTIKFPCVAPLYFQSSTSSASGGSDGAMTSSVAIITRALPAELLQQCLTEYSDWGDLARLACVQTSWKNLLADAAQFHPDAKWQCANALLAGTNGLAVHATLGLTLLQQLAGPIKLEELKVTLQQEQVDTTLLPTPSSNTTSLDANANNNNNNNNNPQLTTAAAAMRRMAEYYLSPSTSNTDDIQTGLLWLQAAFEIGNDVNAAHEVAVLYESGRDDAIPIDVVAAGRWFFKAATAGHVESMAELALLYELGVAGLEQSDEHALHWYRHAALRGHTTAKYCVGEALEEARGVPHSNVEEACLWYYKAAMDGDEDGKLALRRLADVATRMRLVLEPHAALLNV